jgi:hypothetical protein
VYEQRGSGRARKQRSWVLGRRTLKLAADLSGRREAPTGRRFEPTWMRLEELGEQLDELEEDWKARRAERR